MLRLSVLIALLLGMLPEPAFAQPPNTPQTTYGSWSNGISDDPNYFPLAVWLQSPRQAERYRQAGINLYVGLWDGPTEEQLAALQRAKMPVICSQNEVGLRSEHADIIVGWMHGDEPDNAQARRSGGYGPPIEPSVIEQNYERIKLRDPSRPVLLNLGQGVAYDDYIGRGVRRNHPEDYPLYIRGSDIVSFDIYPAVHDKPEVAGKLEFVPRGVERLRRWSNDEKIVWNCIECSRISNVSVKPTPEQVRAEVWMSLIKGSRGIIYFVHQFEPTFKEASLLEDEELLPAVTKLNQQILRLAPVLNSPTIEDAAAVEAAQPDAPLALMCKRHDGSLYLFVANLGSAPQAARLRLLQPPAPAARAESIDDGQTVAITDASLSIELGGYGIGLYRVSDESADR